MATYKGIQGFSIQNLSADPSNPIEGQVWYNSTSNVWKVEELTTAGSWATGNNTNTAGSSRGGAGIQTAGLIFAGQAPPTFNRITETEEYDGSTWTIGGSLPLAKANCAGLGTQTAAVNATGQAPVSPNPSTGIVSSSEEYDGTSWTASNPVNTGRWLAGSAGTQTAGLIFGGAIGSGAPINATGATEEYNGTSWATSPGSLNTARAGLAAAGTQTAALGAGGVADPGSFNLSEEYNGTSWSAGGTINTTRNSFSGAGTQTAGIVYAGNPITGATETYDGNSWTTEATMATARYNTAGASSAPNSQAMVGSGALSGTSNTAATEEWTGAGAAVTKTITVS